MFRITMDANGSVEPSGLLRDSLLLKLSGTFGGGTLVVEKYSDAADAFIPVASYTSAPDVADELLIGKGRVQFSLSGATTPNLIVDYWSL